MTTDDDHSLGGQLAALEPTTDPLDRQAMLARVQQGLFAEAEQPARIGRFVVLQRLGTGASGVVYAAYDPQLDRRVALKLLRTDGDLPPQARTRLLREAQALARLAHPHVVAVHEVGDVDGRVFIAMELLSGGTLRQWAQAEPRRPAQVLATYLQAGEGLAAAHAAGLVHRDFKPDNVLLDRRGRVRVVDFGLAREHGEAGRSMVEALVTHEFDRPVRSETLTRTGAVVGTPAYMAPEQIAGHPADARTDQYAFCVALYEALYGERPFAGDTLSALFDAVERGEVRPPRPGRSVPPRVRRALLRGLRTNPAQRYPTMLALLDALRRDPLARWRRAGLVATGAAALMGVTWMAADRPEAAAAPCSGFEDRLAGVWDAPRREALARTLGQHGARGREAWSRAQPRLHAYAEAWVDARRDACEATEVRRVQSDELLERRALCLDRALDTLDAAVERLADPDPEVIARVGELVPDRSLVDECSAEGVLDDGDLPPPDPELRRRIAAVEARIAAAKSLLAAGRYRAGHALAEAVVGEAEPLGHAPTLARAQWVLGTALTYARRPQEAIDVLAQARAEAERGRADRTRMWASTRLVRRLADTGQFAEARRTAMATEALMQRLSHPPPGADARMELLWADVEWDEGHYDAAIERMDRAISLTKGSTDPEVRAIHIDAFSNRGLIAREVGQSAEAKTYLERAIPMRIELDGPDHPQLAVVFNSLGAAEQQLGHYDDAERLLRQALAIRERRLGPDHDSLAPTLGNLGAVLLSLGRETEALALMERALTLMERSLGPRSAELAAPLHNLALVYLRSDEPERAQAAAARALEIRRDVLGPLHARTLASLYQVAYVDGGTGRRAEARAGYEQLLALLREHRPDDDASIVEALIGASDMALALDDPRAALRAMEQAEPRLERMPQAELLRIAVDFNHAQALERLGRQPARALQLARRALQGATALPHAQAQREVIEDWLAARTAADH